MVVFADDSGGISWDDDERLKKWLRESMKKRPTIWIWLALTKLIVLEPITRTLYIITLRLLPSYTALSGDKLLLKADPSGQLPLNVY